jgi:hypothetical protein
MRSLAAIRTNRWTEEEERLLARLTEAFGTDVVVVFHNRPADVTPPVQVIDVSDAWLQSAGLAHVGDWGWRCGDYFYYALRQARPGFDAYWLIEPDVHFTSDPTAFFAAFEDDGADALGYGLGPFARDIRFTRGLPGIAHHRAIFAMTRFSGRALDRLFALRRGMASERITPRDYPNDEIFTFSHVVADPDLTTGRLEARCPDWFDGAQFATDPDLLHDLLAPSATPGRVFHPVRSRAAFVRALAKRIAGNVSIVARMRFQVAALTDDEAEAVALATAEIARKALSDMRRLRRRQSAAQTRKQA